MSIILSRIMFFVGFVLELKLIGELKERKTSYGKSKPKKNIFSKKIQRFECPECRLVFKKIMIMIFSTKIFQSSREISHKIFF